MKKEHQGFLFGLLAAFMSAITAFFIKLAATVPNETMVFVRFFIATLFFLPGIISGKVNFRSKYTSKHIVRGLAGLAAIYCYFYSVKELPLFVAVTIFNTAPLFLPLVVFFWSKTIIPTSRIMALVIGFIGVVVVLHPDAEIQIIATFIGLLGGFFSATAQVGVRQLSKVESTTKIMTYYFVIASFVSFFPMAFAWEPITEPMNWFYLILIALCSLAFQFCLVKALTHAPVTKVSTMTYLGVVFSGLLGWWFLNEVPTSWTVCGIAIIIIAGLIALFSKSTTRKRTGY